MDSIGTTAQNTASQIPAYGLGAILLGAGVTHFVSPKTFDWMVPTALPGSQRFYTYASGVAELVNGGLVLAPRTRRSGALAAATLFVAVFPANVNGVVLWWDKPWPVRLGLIARLPLQIPLVMVALKARRNA